MVLEIVCVEPIYPQYSGVLETYLALRYWFFEVLGSESVKRYQTIYVIGEIAMLIPILLSRRLEIKGELLKLNL